MIFSYNWLQSFFKEKLPQPKKLAEILTMRSFEVETAERRGKDWVLDVVVLPNRGPDCLSHLGVAREIAAITKSKIKNQKSKIQIKNQKLKSGDFVKLEIQNKDDCPRYSAKVITGVKVGESPKWMQERLSVCGLQPINNIVDIANYVMLEIGQPIHTFDFEKISGIQNQKSKSKNQKHELKIRKIIIRRARKGERIKALDNEIYQLDSDILVIADEKEVIGIAGVKGGESTGINFETKNVIIEAANFNQMVVRRGSQKLKLRTDASWRFEQGIDPNLIDIAQQRAAVLLQELAGGKAADGLADFYPKKILPKKIKLDLEYVEKLLGVKIPIKEIKTVLKSLDFQCAENGSRHIVVRVPTRRLDISLSEDLIEEIGRIYDYEKILPVSPSAGLIPAKGNSDLFWLGVIRDRLKELGLCEVYNYSFISQKDKEDFGFGRDLVELVNPISSEFQYLRPTLLVNLLKNAKQNAKYFDRLYFFEIGRIFRRCQMSNVKCKNQMSNVKTSVLEKTMLSGLVFGKEKEQKLNIFYEAKGIVDALLEKLGIADIWYDDYQPTSDDSNASFWQKGRCAEIKVGPAQILPKAKIVAGKEELGFLGEISGSILDRMKLGKIVAFEFDFEKLIRYVSEEHEYRPISAFPSAVRDVAVLVPSDIKVVDVLNVISAAGGNLVRDVDLFDIYEGDELPEGKKNFAFHIIFQAEDRTLTAEEIDELMRKIMSALEENLEWEVRK